MTTENENIKDEQPKEEKPTEKMSNADRMREALDKIGSKEVKITPPKGWCQVIFRR